MEYLQPFTPKQQRKLKENYASLDFQEGGVIPADSNIIIDDVGVSSTDRESLDQLTSRRLLFIEPSNLMPKAIEGIDSSLNDGAVLIVPKEGGKKITNRLTQPTSTIEFLVTRDPQNFYQGRLADPLTSQQLLDQLQTTKPEQIAVIDDVVVTGASAKFLKKFTETSLGTTFLWSITNWLMAFPRKTNSPSGINGYYQSTTSLLYAGESGQTPVNTLWDMLYNPKKKDLVVPAYAQKYSPDPKAFQQLIDSLAIKYQGQP